MHAGQCRTFEEVLGHCGLSRGLSQELHSEEVGSRQDSVRGLAWEEAIIEASQCIRMRCFRAHSESEMQEAGLQSHTRHIRWYSILTMQYFVYDPLAKTLHRSRDEVFREGKRYTAPNAADKVIFREHYYRDVIVEPTPTKQSESAHPIEKQPTQRRTEESLDDDSPPDSPKRKKKSQELDGLEVSLGDGWKRPAEGSHRKRTGKNTLAESAHLALEEEEFNDMIPIYTAAEISDDHEDGIHPKSHKAATEYPLAEKGDMAMQEV